MRKATVSKGSDERALVAALRAGDEAAFMTLVERYGPSMLRVARTFVPSPAVAEEVVQEAWLGVLRGLDRFERRSSLKTWIFRILTNVAKTRGERESRSVPFSSLAGDESAEPAVDPSRFDPSQGTQGMWAAPPASWEDVPEDRLLAGETLGEVRAAIAGLPPQQRTVITLRDVEGWTSDEVRNVLDISETNQRVLLHRARSKVRRALEEYVGRYERA
ncbi:MAG TPA: sigma-70 family RNA polymerase sigma factor [Actinomycetota bacterium]|nr:sigma-70 family RNA polymerase sigma factor [Actinomycetota bacterium]